MSEAPDSVRTPLKIAARQEAFLYHFTLPVRRRDGTLPARLSRSNPTTKVISKYRQVSGTRFDPDGCRTANYLVTFPEVLRAHDGHICSRSISNSAFRPTVFFPSTKFNFPNPIITRKLI